MELHVCEECGFESDNQSDFLVLEEGSELVCVGCLCDVECSRR